jgi:5-methylcytosine-specific restriction enzyme subunit McrC
VDILSVTEHESIPVKDIRNTGQRALTQRHVTALERLERKLPAKSLSWGNKSIKFGHYCGVIVLGDLTVEILPKIYGIERDIGSSRESLIRMLSVVRRLKLPKATSASIALQKYSLLDIFILQFCDLLHMLLLQGMIRTYIERQENLHVLRGRLRIEQQLKLNLAHKERLYCQYDELSEDNIYNQLLKYVLKLLSRIAKGNNARIRVQELLMRFDAITDTEATVKLLDSLDFDRSNIRYKPVFDQCRWFLEGFSPDVLAGDKSCFSLLFDMNRLFEGYTAYQLRRVAWSMGLRCREQGPQKYLATRLDIENSIFQMKPDISLLSRSNRVFIIADAKWKILDEGELKLGISQADLYQMRSYAARYRVYYLILVYPMQRGLTKPVWIQFQGSEAKLCIFPLDIHVKQSDHLLISEYISKSIQAIQ